MEIVNAGIYVVGVVICGGCTLINIACTPRNGILLLILICCVKLRTKYF